MKQHLAAPLSGSPFRSAVNLLKHGDVVAFEHDSADGFSSAFLRVDLPGWEEVNVRRTSLTEVRHQRRSGGLIAYLS